MSQPEILSDLGGGLVMRRAVPADSDALSEFNARIHEEKGVGIWTADLLRGNHPEFAPGDFTIVEDVASGKIVSSLNLMQMTWTFDGIPFGAGRPELVGTDPEYRNRGLVRKQFEFAHEWSRERGNLITAVTGIPYYYRIFGYEMALNLGGGRIGYAANLPKLKDGENEPCLFRPAQSDDLPFINDCFNAGMRRMPYSIRRSAQLWEYALHGQTEKNINKVEFRIITDPGGTPLGFLTHPGELWDNILNVTIFELLPQASWQKVSPAVMRYLFKTGQEYAIRDEKICYGYGFHFGEAHPSYQVVGNSLPVIRPPYAWYVRVPDLPAFFRHIAPALETRLQNSACRGYTGEILITFYRKNGLTLGFDQGRLVRVETTPVKIYTDAQAAFPEHTFLQLLFQHRSLDELKHTFADISAKDEAGAVLNALFPRCPSDFPPVGL